MHVYKIALQNLFLNFNVHIIEHYLATGTAGTNNSDFG